MSEIVKPTPEQIAAILAEHAKWLNGQGGTRADLGGADLGGADLGGANLGGANLYGANLSWANLSWADLSRADLSRANLSWANLSWANLSWADLSWADLSRADLSRALNAALVFAQTEILPREGQVTGWKKCRGGVLVKVRVPPESPRSNASTRKCRAGWVEVLEVIGGDVGVSLHDGVTEYRAGQVVKADKWCEDRWQECAGGIHFFLTREEASNWSG